jgi:hypothetical protein
VGQHNYFRAMRENLEPDVKKLYRVNQDKVLAVIRAEAHRAHEDKAKKIDEGKDKEDKNRADKDKDLSEVREDPPDLFEDVRGGVCFALSFMWLYAMLDKDKRPASYKKFKKREAKYENQAKYFRDAEVIQIQRDYRKLRVGKTVSQPHLTPFVEKLLKDRGLKLQDAQYRNLQPGTSSLAQAVRDQIRQHLDNATRKKALGICIGIERRGSDAGHEVAAFRKPGAKEPLVFFDANCGCYEVALKDEVQRAFFNAWLNGYKTVFGSKEVFSVKELFVVTLGDP